MCTLRYASIGSATLLALQPLGDTMTVMRTDRARLRSHLADLATCAIALVDQGVHVECTEVHAAARESRLVELVIASNERTPTQVVHGLSFIQGQELNSLEATLSTWLSVYGDRRKSGIEQEGLLLIAVAACWSATN